MFRAFGVRLLSVVVGASLVGAVGLSEAMTASAEPTGALVDACAAPSGSDTYDSGAATASLVVRSTAADCRRTYRLTSSELGSPEQFTERSGEPSVRTGSALLDGLYAFALHEARENEVDQISDGNYNGGAPIACGQGQGGCFITGKNWPYVWTRDVSYSADLGLASVDPVRMRNTLEFKLSTLRDGSSDEQIIQDTGSGGSYPNSTDRVTWALGAEEVLNWLPDDDRAAFASRALAAISNTVDHDRVVVYDPVTGLYQGETSFLDWRQQEYPAWTADDVTQITTSEALSTNVVHWVALDAAARLAQSAGQPTEAAKYRGWADSLKAAIRDRFWLPDQHRFSIYLPSTLNRAAADRSDALGTALAVITGVATDAQAAQAVASYPQTEFGPTVIWPQQQEDTRSYHNKGIWPFVTAYLLRAAATAGNDQAAARQVDSIVRATTLFGSNYENMNAQTGGIDTVLNSPRQLWSIGGSIGMFQEVLFGVEAQDEGLTVDPFLPAQVRQRYFPQSSRIALNDLDFRGHKVTVVLDLPASSATQGAYTVTGLTLDGVPRPAGSVIDESDLGTSSVIEVRLGAPAATVAASPLVGTTGEAFFGPKTPSVTVLPATTVEGDPSISLDIDLAGEDPSVLTMDVLRDGRTVAKGIPASTTWTDPHSSDLDSVSYCYVVRLHYVSSQNASQDSDPQCFWGTGSAHDMDQRILKAPAADFVVQGAGGTATENGVITHYTSWGNGAGDTITATVTPSLTGSYLLQSEYARGGSIPDGIDSGIKTVTVRDAADGTVVATGEMVMPRTGGWDKVKNSTTVRARLEAGHTYDVVLSNDQYSVNMSYFTANELFNETVDDHSNFEDVYMVKALLTQEELPLSVSAQPTASTQVGQAVVVAARLQGGQVAAPGLYEQASIDWGDDTSATSLSLTRDEPGTGFEAAPSHTYTSPGTYTATVTVFDGTTTDRATTTVAVVPAPVTEPAPAVVTLSRPAFSNARQVADAKKRDRVTVTTVVTGIESGTVTFRDGSVAVGTAPVRGGEAALLLPRRLSVGTHHLTAFMAGSATHLSATSPTSAALRVTKAALKKLRVTKVKGSKRFAPHTKTRVKVVAAKRLTNGRLAKGKVRVRVKKHGSWTVYKHRGMKTFRTHGGAIKVKIAKRFATGKKLRLKVDYLPSQAQRPVVKKAHDKLVIKRKKR